MIDVVCEEYNFKESVGALFVPEGMWGGTSALRGPWVDITSFDNVFIGLSEA